MRAVLDASAVLEGFEPSPPSDFAVPSAVVEEVSRGRAGRRMESLLAAGLEVRDPQAETVAKVEAQARLVGEETRISQADMHVLALALEAGVPAVTDDYSVQNVGACLGVDTIAFKQRGIEEIWRWGIRCPGCLRWFEEARTPECPVCGTRLRTSVRR